MKVIREFASLATSSESNGHANLKIELQTNGVFSRSVALWLADNIDIIWISIDGPPSIQDAQRPLKGMGKSSEIVERNIRTILDRRSGLVIGARSTITPLNVHHQIEMVEYFHSLGLKAVFSDPVFPQVDTLGPEHLSPETGNGFMMEYAREYLGAQQRAQDLGIFYGSIFTVNFDEETSYFCRSCLPCPHLTPDGYVSCCDMAALGSMLPQLIYGKYNVDTGRIEYDEQIIATIQSRRAENLIECQKCEIVNYCAGACLGEGVNETGCILGVKTTYCEAIRFLANNIPLGIGLYPYLHP
jgi:radical SAM protein with 4Fe4S-binding SPASM domain